MLWRAQCECLTQVDVDEIEEIGGIPEPNPGRGDQVQAAAEAVAAAEQPARELHSFEIDSAQVSQLLGILHVWKLLGGWRELSGPWEFEQAAFCRHRAQQQSAGESSRHVDLHQDAMSVGKPRVDCSIKDAPYLHTNPRQSIKTSRLVSFCSLHSSQLDLARYRLRYCCSPPQPRYDSSE